MYARIFPSRGFRVASFIIGGIAVAWVISIICVSVFQCNPIAKAWNTSLPGTCINLKGSFIGNAVPNIVTDIAILSMPVHVVWGLHATLTHRLSVIAIFLLGSLYVQHTLRNLSQSHTNDSHLVSSSQAPTDSQPSSSSSPPIHPGH